MPTRSRWCLPGRGGAVVRFRGKFRGCAVPPGPRAEQGRLHAAHLFGMCCIIQNACCLSFRGEGIGEGIVCLRCVCVIKSFASVLAESRLTLYVNNNCVAASAHSPITRCCLVGLTTWLVSPRQSSLSCLRDALRLHDPATPRICHPVPACDRPVRLCTNRLQCSAVGGPHAWRAFSALSPVANPLSPP